MSQNSDPNVGRVVHTSDRGTLRYLGAADLDGVEERLPGASRSSTRRMSEGHWRNDRPPVVQPPAVSASTATTATNAPDKVEIIDHVPWATPQRTALRPSAAPASNSRRTLKAGVAMALLLIVGFAVIVALA